MDTRDTPEQAELRRAAHQLARELGPVTVAGIDDRARRQRLAAAVRDAGWLELRDDTGDGAPLATGAEAAIVAAALGESVADVAWAGPLLGADLARRAGCTPPGPVAVAFGPALVEPAVVGTGGVDAPLYAVDADGVHEALVLVPEGDGFRLGTLPLGDPGDVDGGGSAGADLTRAIARIAPGTPVGEVPGPRRTVDADDLASFAALGLALTSADLVGSMRGVLDITVAYAAERRQYGVAVGSFQAVQHLLAEARCLLEGSVSVAQHAAWAVDSLAPRDALAAGRVAKAYCARAARTVCETAVQVHGGIGNTWECIVHVYLRRALLSSQWFGDDGEQLRCLQHDRLGVAQGVASGLS